MSFKTASSLNRNASQIPREMSEMIQARIDQEQALRKHRQSIIVVGVPDLGNQAVPKPHASYSSTANNPESLPEVVFTKPQQAAQVSEAEISDAEAREKDCLFEKERDYADAEQPTKEMIEVADRLDHSGGSVAAETLAHDGELDQIAISLKEMMERQESDQDPRSRVDATNRARAEERDSQWKRTEQDQSKSDRAPAVSPADKENGVGLPLNTEIDKKAIGNIADQILKKFPGSGATAVIGFAATESNSDVSEMCAAVAHELATRDQGHVLLIDGDFETGKMSTAARKSTVNGLKNLLMRSTMAVDETLVKSNSLPLDFLPAGNIKVKYWLRASERLQDILQQVRPAYRFVCVSLGDAHWKSTKVVSSSCDGVYLFLNMRETSRVVAESATQQFYESGTPLLGCVVSDVPAAAA